VNWTRLLIFTLFVMLGFVFFVQTPHAKENSLKKGKWALQFQIDNNFHLSSFQGSTLSLKKHTSDTRALRLGLSVQFEYNDGQLDRPLYGPGNSPGNREFINHSYKLDLQKLYYVNSSAAVNLFFGIGPTASYNYSKDERDTRNDDNSFVDYWSYKSSGYSAGVAGIIGVEWFASKDISLLAEYETSILYRGSARETTRNTVQSSYQFKQYDYQSSDGILISSAAVKFGLSVYF